MIYYLVIASVSWGSSGIKDFKTEVWPSSFSSIQECEIMERLTEGVDYLNNKRVEATCFGIPQ